MADFEIVSRVHGAHPALFIPKTENFWSRQSMHCLCPDCMGDPQKVDEIPLTIARGDHGHLFFPEDESYAILVPTRHGLEWLDENDTKYDYWPAYLDFQRSNGWDVIDLGDYGMTNQYRWAVGQGVVLDTEDAEYTERPWADFQIPIRNRCVVYHHARYVFDLGVEDILTKGYLRLDRMVLEFDDE